MQQLEWCKQILKLPNFPEVRIKGYGFVGSPQLILFALLVSLSLSAILKSINPNYLIIGVLLPLFFALKGLILDNYWQAFAFLLLLRRYTDFLVFLDPLLLICLWNPNIDLAKRIKEWFNLTSQSSK